MKTPLPWLALAALLAALGGAGCTLDTSTPSGWQTPGPRTSASLAAPVTEQ